MNWIVYHFISGDAFFTGAAMILGSLVIARFSRHKPALHWLQLGCGAAGVGLIGLSSTPLPWFWYAGWAVIVVYAGWATTRSPRMVVTFWNSRETFWIPAVVLTLGSMVWEASQHRLPVAQAGNVKRLIVVGDSLSAGLGEKGVVTWPTILQRKYGLNVIDYSAPGATVPSMLKRASTNNFLDGVIVLEIGGNDVLAEVPPSEFEQHLEALLQKARRQRATSVIMLELPLPPFSNAYGRIQRQAAARHSVTLVPKCYLARILCNPAATSDGLHLSQLGQESLAALIWNVIRPSIDSTSSVVEIAAPVASAPSP